MVKNSHPLTKTSWDKLVRGIVDILGVDQKLLLSINIVCAYKEN